MSVRHYYYANLKVKISISLKFKFAFICNEGSWVYFHIFKRHFYSFSVKSVFMIFAYFPLDCCSFFYWFILYILLKNSFSYVTNVSLPAYIFLLYTLFLMPYIVGKCYCIHSNLYVSFPMVSTFCVMFSKSFPVPRLLLKLYHTFS